MTFKAIGITATTLKDTALQMVTRLIEFMHESYPQIKLSLDERCQSCNETYTIPTGSLENICQEIDLIICIGGDGTLIELSKTTTPLELPVLGINLGTLGYLVDILPNQIQQKLSAILKGEYWIEKKTMLSAEMYAPDSQLKQPITSTNIAAHSTTNEFIALNEIVIQRFSYDKLIDLEVFVDGEFLVRQRSDGLIINTPTGSTAYALSAGGAIISPKNKAIGLTPICPHTLSYRPLILKDTSIIEVITHNQDSELKADAVNINTVQVGYRVRIAKHHKKFLLVHPQDYSEFKTLRSKLRWG